jgi:hypothetical protein
MASELQIIKCEAEWKGKGLPYSSNTCPKIYPEDWEKLGKYSEQTTSKANI